MNHPRTKMPRKHPSICICRCWFSALTFQHWQVKSSVSVWRDAMQGRLLNGALTAFDRYHVFALSHQTQNCGRYNLLPHARHAMPPWPDWACAHKQTSEVTGNPKCHLKVGLWLMTPHRGEHADNSETPANKENAKATTESFWYAFRGIFREFLICR